MAFVENDQEDEQNPNQVVGNSNLSTANNTNPNASQTPSQTQSGPISPGGGTGAVHLSPSSGVGSAAGGGSGTRGTGTEPSGGTGSGGQFATLNDYVNANAPAAQTLANDVIQPIANQYNTDAANNANVESNINSSINSGYTPYQDLSSQINPTNVAAYASNPNNVATFQGQANDTYTGPQSAEGTSSYQSALANENQQIQEGQASTGTTAGQEGLLKSAETAVPNNPGVTGLNEAILTSDPTYQTQVENAYKPFSSLVSGLQSYAPTADAAIASGQGQATQASTQANQDISNNVSSLNNSLISQMGTDNADVAQNNAGLTAYQKEFNPISTDINALNQDFAGAQVPTDWGGAFGQLTNPYTSTLSQIPINESATEQNVATPQQYAQANAYQNLLSGITAGDITPDINNSTVGQAGTATDPGTFVNNNTPAIDQNIVDQFNTATSTPNAAGKVWNGYNWVTSNADPNQAAFFQQYEPTYQNLISLLQQLDPNLNNE